MGIEPRVSVTAAGKGFNVRSPSGPLKLGLWLPTQGLAEAIAEEWRNPGSRPERPLTKLAGRSMEITAAPDQAVASISVYGASDLLCYREPMGGALAERQDRVWQPLLDWATARHGISLVVTHGIAPVEQGADALRKIEDVVSKFGPYELAALEAVTAVCGSVIVALAHFTGEIDEAQAWEACAVEESHQMETWGQDEEAVAALAGRERALTSATQFFRLLKDDV